MLATLNRPRWTMSPADIFREVDQVLDSVLAPKTAGGDGVRLLVAPLTLWEDDKKVYLEFDMPGFSLDDVDLTIEAGVLYLRGERKVPESCGKCWCNERTFGLVERSVRLSETVDCDSINAEFRDGVLAIEFQKKPEAVPAKIAIKHGGDAKKLEAKKS